MIAYRITVFGIVQGVFYRASTKQIAERLGIKGWVRNESNGSVLMEIEGDQKIIEKMVDWCKFGPELATVDRISKEEILPRGFDKFEIR